MPNNKPWLKEPNRKEWTAHGSPCLILRTSELGSLCGYVGIPEGHPYYGKPYSDLDDIEVHGGLTFAGMGDGDLRPVGLYWLGFDCGHAGDLCPGIGDILRRGGVQVPYLIRTGDIYRDIGYVTKQTESLAKQLAEKMIPFGAVLGVLDSDCW